MKAVSLALFVALGACVPYAPELSGERETATRPMPKPAPAPAKPPAGVTVVKNPDGSISVTIREPLDPTVSPWRF